MPEPKPNFLIIGAAKAGTTALFQYFSQHPEIFVAEPKEPHYLAFGEKAAAFTGPGDDITINAKAITDRATYFGLFSDSDQYAAACEGSVSTLYYGEQAAPRIEAELGPETKLICLLRNPTDRAFSAYSFLRSRVFEPEADFARALDLEDERVAAGYHHMWHYRGMGRYAEQLEQFSAFAERGNLHVVLYDDLRSDVDAVLEAAFDFIGVSREFEPTFVPSPHKSGEPSIEWLSRLLTRDSKIKSLVKPLLSGRVRAAMRDKASSVAVKKQEIDPAVRASLVADFVPEVEKLEALIDRDLSAWKTP